MAAGVLVAAKIVALVVTTVVTIASMHQHKESNVFSNPIMLIGCVVVGLVAANFLFGKKTATAAAGPALGGPILPQTNPVSVSIRQQQADEAAAAIATFFRKADEEAWVDEQIDRAQTYFSRGKPSTPSKS